MRPRHLRRIGGALAALLPLAVLAAPPVPSVEAGRWEVMVVRDGEAPLIHYECLQADHLQRLVERPSAPPDECRDRGLRRAGPRYIREFDCLVGGRQERRRSVWEYKSPQFIAHRSERIAGGKTETVATVDMVHAGACRPPNQP